MALRSQATTPADRARLILHKITPPYLRAFDAAREYRESKTRNQRQAVPAKQAVLAKQWKRGEMQSPPNLSAVSGAGPSAASGAENKCGNGEKDASASRGASKISSGWGTPRSYNRTLVQACFERANLLSTPTPLPEGCRFVNTTVDEDFTTTRGVEIAVDALKGPHDAVWFAPPCTGESTWQRLNIVRHPHLVDKLNKDRALFLRLLKSFNIAAQQALAMNARVYMEPPRY